MLAQIHRTFGIPTYAEQLQTKYAQKLSLIAHDYHSLQTMWKEILEITKLEEIGSSPKNITFRGPTDEAAKFLGCATKCMAQADRDFMAIKQIVMSQLAIALDNNNSQAAKDRNLELESKMDPLKDSMGKALAKFVEYANKLRFSDRHRHKFTVTDANEAHNRYKAISDSIPDYEDLIKTSNSRPSNTMI